LSSAPPEADLTAASATTLARMIRERRASSAEVVEAHLRRIADVNPRLNAVVQLDDERALAAARDADAALARGEAPGPLHGVPFTVKDWLDAEGLICAAGYEERRDFLPKRDATAVARMRAAGAIVLGKTKSGDEPDVYPAPHNPYDPERTPGASSSGEAAIIAACGSPLGIGSDSGGSLRLPAAWCGVAAHKPTSGLVPLTGHFPRIYALGDPRTVVGPLARHADDLALALRVIAGPDGRDPSVMPIPVGDVDAIHVRSLRVAWYAGMPGASPSPAAVVTVEAAARALADAGAAVTEATPPRLDESMPITLFHWARARSISLQEWRPSRESSLSADEIERRIFEWDRFRAALLRFMQDYDVILCPAAQDVAPAARPARPEDYIYTLPYSLTAWPVTTVRCGTSPEGMPLGVQVVAPAWQDHVAIAAAATLERAFASHRTPPPL
jgi:amidase